MGRLVDLKGVAGGVIEDVGWANNVSRAMDHLSRHRAVTGAGDRGAWTVWKDDNGKYRCDFSRFRSPVSEETFSTKKQVREWLREWLPKAE